MRKLSILGPRLFWPKAAAVVLGVYALCYGLFLTILIIGAPDVTVTHVGFLALYALAATPFFAFFNLVRATTPDADPPARPVLMAVIMAAPTLFWLYMTVTTLPPLRYLDVDQIMMIAGFLGVPGVLSLWLMVTFLLLALRGDLADDPQTAGAGSDIE